MTYNQNYSFQLRQPRNIWELNQITGNNWNNTTGTLQNNNFGNNFNQNNNNLGTGQNGGSGNGSSQNVKGGSNLGSTLSYATQAVTSGIQFGGAIANTFGNMPSEENKDEYVKQQNSYFGDIGYQEDVLDAKKWREDVKKENAANTWTDVGAGAGFGAAAGATVGSIFPGIGTAIGGAVGAIGGALSGLFVGIFGSAERDAAVANAIQQSKENLNTSNRYRFYKAASQSQQQRYYQNNADTQQGMIYAKDGLDLGYKGFKRMINNRVRRD